MNFLFLETAILWGIVFALLGIFFVWLKLINRWEIGEWGAVGSVILLWILVVFAFFILRRVVLPSPDEAAQLGLRIVPAPWLMQIAIWAGPLWMLNHFTKRKLWWWNGDPAHLSNKVNSNELPEIDLDA